MSVTANGVKDRIHLWVDCDPGHDDAVALLLAGHYPKAELMGVSTLFGNQVVESTTSNACMVLHAAGLPKKNVYKGQSKPLIRPLQTCAAIHGDTGLDLRFEDGEEPIDTAKLVEESRYMMKPTKAISAIRDAVLSLMERDPNALLHLIAVGALTNVALLLTVYPELIPNIKVVCMGGSIGVGNIGPVVEFNFHIDPEAAKIVFLSGVHLTMIPLEVTNTALATEEVLHRVTKSKQTSRFRSFVRAILLYYEQTNKTVFGFDHPPVHDPCAVFCALEPEYFQLDHMRVDIETNSDLSAGQSVCDVWRQSTLPPNCYVGRKMNVEKFWDAVLDSVAEADQVSPLNKPTA